MKDLDIAEVARASGMAASALRFYEEQGLIAPIGRVGLRRLYDPGVLEQLTLIQLGRAAGFSLQEIAAMFAQGGRPRIDRKKLATKADELDRTIRELMALRDGLMRYDHGRGWRDSGLSVDMSRDWRSQLALADYGVGYPDWRAAVVVDKAGHCPQIEQPSAVNELLLVFLATVAQKT